MIKFLKAIFNLIKGFFAKQKKDVVKNNQSVIIKNVPEVRNNRKNSNFRYLQKVSNKSNNKDIFLRQYHKKVTPKN